MCRQPRLLCLALFAAAALISPLSAQQRLEKHGGAIPGVAQFGIHGQPNANYGLIFSFTEQPTSTHGVTFDITLDQAGVSFQIPGFLGTLDANGDVNISLPIPDMPSLAGITLSMQSFQFHPISEVSNLVRFRMRVAETFSATLGDALAPIVTGAAFPQANGKILLMGGSGPIVQEYDPDLEEFSLHGLVPSANILATQTQLADGRILVAGGLGLAGQPVADSFIYDPATRLSTPAASMNTPRAAHAAAPLDDGRVLVVGGARSFNFADLPAFLAGILASSEFYNPATDTFTPGPNLLEQKMFHSATVLGNGDIMVAGGLSVLPIVNIPIVSPTAQSYSQFLGIFGLPSLMGEARMLHSAVTLQSGDALLAGGLSIDFTVFLTSGSMLDLRLESVANVVRYRPGLFGGFSSPIPISDGRILPLLAPLDDREALVAGGIALSLAGDLSTLRLEGLQSADLVDSSTGGSSRPVGDLAAPRTGGVAVPLPDGTILVTGGGPLTGEIYQPN
ncbi:MAG: kelch repeat-containing protein [Planctomycetota bacterium]